MSAADPTLKSPNCEPRPGWREIVRFLRFDGAMSVVSTPVGASGRATGLYASWQTWWEGTTAASRTRFQVATFLVVTILAYHYSLDTLVGNLDLSTPLAYVGLVPVIALGLGAARMHPAANEPAVFDRQLDYIVGVPLIGIAVIIETLLPNRLSAMFWVWRIDLFSFPLFAAGAVALLFGTRAMLRQKLALGYLFFAWPLPYTLLLLQVLDGFTNVTISALHLVVRYLHVATVLPGSGGSLFQVSYHGTSFPLSVVSACSGVDSVVGFLLVGSAFAALVEGPRLRKTLWLGSGMALLWAINVGRIIFIFWAGRTWGEHIAINILHPFVGLVTFSLGVVLMMVVMPALGLRIAVNAAAPDGPAGARRRPLPVRNVLPAVGILLAAGMVLGVNNTGLRAYDVVAGSTGEAKLASFSADPASPAGWQANYETAYTWATPYFGDNSTWLRYLYSSTGQGGDLHASLPVTADVIDTTNLESFSAYGVEACYNFHGYAMKDVAQVTLTGHITGQALSYATGHDGTWTIVYWIMPVKPVKATGSTHYERVILYLQDTPQTTVSYTGTLKTGAIKSIEGALSPTTAEDKRLISDRTFLVQFADEVITNQTKIVAGSTLQQATLAQDQQQTSAPSATLDQSLSDATPSFIGGVRFSAQAPAYAPVEFARLTQSAKALFVDAHPTWFVGG
jgi:exosortase/archaeosortase family protein